MLNRVPRQAPAMEAGEGGVGAAATRIYVSRVVVQGGGTRSRGGVAAAGLGGQAQPQPNMGSRPTAVSHPGLVGTARSRTAQ